MIVGYAEAANAIGTPTLAADPQFMAVCDAADSFVKGYCRRQFEFGRYTLTTAGTDAFSIVVPEIIADLVSISIDAYGEFLPDTVQDITRFVIDGQTITSFDTPFFASHLGGNVAAAKIVFDGGYYPNDDPDPLHVPKMPADLRRAVMLMIAHEWRIGHGEQMRSERLGEYSYQRSGVASRAATGNADHFPYDDRVRQVLDAYSNW